MPALNVIRKAKFRAFSGSSETAFEVRRLPSVETLALYQGSGGLHGDILRCAAEFKVEIHGEALIHLQLHRTSCLFESALAGRDPVLVRA